MRGATREQEETATGRRIQWAEDVIDNEGMGKKKSKGLSPFADEWIGSVANYGQFAAYTTPRKE